MNTTLIDGKLVADSLYQTIKKNIEQLVPEGNRPCLAAILVGNNPASESYIANKIKSCQKVGIKSEIFRFPDTIGESEILQKIIQINEDPAIHGVIVQLPLPSHISEYKILETISPFKDVDGFTPYNIGKMVLGLDAFYPATPAGIIELLKFYKIPTMGKKAVVIGRSNIVGTPVSILLSRNTEYGNATVTLCHSKSRDLIEIVRDSEIIIAAAGVPNMIKSEWIKERAVIIDVGIHRVKSEISKSGYKLIGDVDFENVAPKCSHITPVPGGVGPMTVAMLISNTFKAFSRELKV